MPLPTLKPLPLSTSPSTGPTAARVATQDAQIAQLVQQVRTLEHTITQQRVQLDAEKARGVAAVNQIKEQWRTESKEWRDGCDALQSKHRLAHLGTRVALENERSLRLVEKEALVREKIARLHREHRITLFQARETHFVSHIVELEDEIEARRNELVRAIAQHEEEVARLTVRLAMSDNLRQERTEELGDFAQEKAALETEITTSRATVASNVKQIERLNLQVDMLRTQNATLDERNRELQHQVDKWQTLENKGEKEVVELRKRRMELEVRVKELEVSLNDSYGIDKKIAMLEDSLLETQEQVEKGNQQTSEAQNEAVQARKQAARLEGKVAKLQAALEAEKMRSTEALEKQRKKVHNQSQSSNGKIRPEIPSVIAEVSEDSDDEIVESLAKPPSRNQKHVSRRSERARSKERINQHNGSETECARGKGESQSKGREKGTMYQDEEEKNEIFEGEGDILQEVAPVKTSHRRLRHQEQDSEIAEVPPPTQKKLESRLPQPQPIDDPDAAKKLRDRGGKAKSDEDEDDVHEARPKKRSRSKPPSVSGDRNGKKQPETTDAENEDEQTQTKKKRKLNITGSTIFSRPASFTWDQDGDGGLGIPSELSPVKEGEPVPPRAGSSSLLGAWKLWK